MSPKAVGRVKAEAIAGKTLAQLHVDRPPIPVEAICAQLQLRVVYETLPFETSSVLIRQPDNTLVLGVNSRHPVRRQRFSLAHELGHARLHLRSVAPKEGEAFVTRPLQVLFRDGVAGQGVDPVEIDANAFAAALLMPEAMVKGSFAKRLRQEGWRPVEDVVDDLADEFDVSSQAMQIRLVNLDLVDPA